MLYVSFDFQITVMPLAYNIVHLLTALVSFAFVVKKFPNLQLAENVDFHQVGSRLELVFR